MDLLEPPTPMDDHAASPPSESKAKNGDLSPAMRDKIERNRQRAVMMRQARLANRPSAGKRCGTSAKVAKTVDSGGGFFIDEEEEKQGQRKWCINQEKEKPYTKDQLRHSEP